ncbi:FAD-dependent oxidoreductase [Methanobacterium petrolearium]|uniref:FAD-dependent oxidoreductase n=1 Tax=Methanobacterium petrolearium TaxID=710190 RepID=UPI001AE86311|nr:NAD(P)/FAD-dependent oxidoreductase [Methanobacterium petrolearium]MBP1946874.1 dihydrolipoamide dehydrogenase [Methanobacterium petrolearium]BDZ70488.1 dihydrolipoamide dehydrogenase [Methanobacterium petrolearium]
MKMVIIGGGPAGRTAATEAAQLDAEVTLIERKHIGGTCLHEGCMVVCGLNEVVRFHENSKKFHQMSIISNQPQVDYSKVVQGIKKVIGKIERVLKHETRQSGVEIVLGEASKINEETVEVDGEEYPYDKLLISTGSRPFIPPVLGVENALTYRDVLNFKEVPEKLNIVGSGVIAAEFAGIFSSLGSQVKVLCRGSFLRNLDGEIKKYVLEHLLRDVEITENVQVNEITSEGAITSGGEVEGPVFLATGMTPNSEIAENLVEIGSKGQIRVNKQMKTSNSSIYAAGDVVGTVGNTPVARREGVVAARNACEISATMDYSIIPQSLTLYYPVSFLNTESEFKNFKDESEAFNVRIRGSGGPGSFWNVLEGNTGFTKMSANLKTGDILSASSISPSSSTSIPYLAKMIKDGYKTSDFDDFIETHPSTDAIYKLLHFLAKYG